MPQSPEERAANLARGRAKALANRKAKLEAAANNPNPSLPPSAPGGVSGSEAPQSTASKPRPAARASAPPAAAPSPSPGMSAAEIAALVASSVAAAMAPMVEMFAASQRANPRGSFVRGELPRGDYREPVRQGVVAMGRGGEQLTRMRTQVGDPYDIPLEAIPQGWSYQWNAITVNNSPDPVANQARTMYANGWRAVPADRHPGMFTAPGATGEILVGGLRLEERPMEMTKEAQREDALRAGRQIADQVDGLRMVAAKKMPTGFSVEEKYRGTRPQISMGIDPGSDIPSPQHQAFRDE